MADSSTPQMPKKAKKAEGSTGSDESMKRRVGSECRRRPNRFSYGGKSERDCRSKPKRCGAAAEVAESANVESDCR